MMKIINPNIKIGIISSLIATAFFLYFLDPIFIFLGRTFLKVGSWIFQGYIDRLYQEIAVGQQDYAHMLFVLLFTFNIILLSFGLIYIIKKTNQKKLIKEKAISLNEVWHYHSYL